MRHTGQKRIRYQRSGIVSVWVSLTLLLMLAFIGFAADSGWVYMVQAQLQNAADAGALAAAIQLPSTTNAYTQAYAVAQANKAGGVAVQLAANAGNASTGDVVIGVYNRANATFTATLTSPNAVKVTCRRTSSSPGGALPLHFAALAGFSTSNITCYAIAMTSATTVGAGVILLDPTGSGSLYLNGNGALSVVNNGAVIVDSNSSTAVTDKGNNASVEASALYITGDDTAVVAGSSFYPSGTLTLQSPPAPDPLAGLPTPAKGTTQTIPKGKTATLNPGYYPSGISLSGQDSYTLNAGIYYIVGGISLTGGSTINATAGVMLYLASGSISAAGNGGININPPTSGTYEGISIFQAYGNTTAATLAGNGSSSSGTLYFPSAAVSLTGNGGALGSQVIAQDATLKGNGSILIDYNGNFPAQIPGQVFLVR